MFGNEDRLGNDAKEFTIDGRMNRDPHLAVWRQIFSDWYQVRSDAEDASWENAHLSAFPGLGRLRALADKKGDAFRNTRKRDKAPIKQAYRKGIAAGKWVLVLTHVLRENYMAKLRNGNRDQRRTLRQIEILEKWMPFLLDGERRARSLLVKLEPLVKHRIYTETTVFLCTVDSTERMLRELKNGIVNDPRRDKKEKNKRLPTITMDTAIMDEAACVLEPAIPMVLALGVKNLTLIGDQHQLQPFSHIQSDSGKGGLCSNHSRSFMERAITAGASSHFLDVQYRMHPAICSVRFYVAIAGIECLCSSNSRSTPL